MNKKIVSLVSGGMDSCTTMAKLAIDGWEVYPLYIDYGQVAFLKELESANNYIKVLQERFKNLHDLEIVKISLPFLRVALTGAKRITKETDKNFHSIESKKIDWVPARNIIFLTIASSYCELLKCRNISIGTYKDDEIQPYPDSSREFFDALEVVLTKGIYGDKFNIITPFVKSFKWGFVKYSKKNKLPIELTWSCYKANNKHCGLCRNCVDRKKAFKRANIADSTKYISK